MNATVIIPAYQAAAFIERCLDSVLLQGEAVAEVFVVDNASTDGTGAVVERWLARHDLPTWHLLHELTPGACAARNAPLERVSHPWIQFLDADDELLPGKVASQLAQARPAVHVLLGSSEHVDEQGRRRTSQPADSVELGLIEGRLGNTCANLFATEGIRRIGGWNPDLSSSQEYDLMFRLWQEGAVFQTVTGIDTRIHERAEGRISTSNLRQKWINHCALQRRMLDAFDLNGMAPDVRHRILQAYFDRIRTLAVHDRKEAVRMFKACALLKGFSPQVNALNSSGYVWAYRLLGFQRVEQLRAWLKPVNP